LLQQKIEAHERFWRGEGPSLILIPPSDGPPYDLKGYPARFHDPRAMWQSEMRRAEAATGWPTDGIPTVRPNLGVIFVPVIAGLGYDLKDEQLPWPGAPLERDEVRAAREVDVAQSELMRLAAEFYAIHHAEGGGEIVAYQADTQGVFDVAHMLYGDEIFLDLADPGEAEWIEELLDLCAELYVRVVRHLKGLLGEQDGSMVHGHGTGQGVYLPTAGTRSCEDTPTLLSPEMIEQRIIPYVERVVAAFGGGFLHFCGRHPSLFERLCRSELVRAIDMGNPEMYDARWMMERCAETGTVLWSGVAAEGGETWEPYVRRLAAIVRDTGARCILRPGVCPRAREECAAMRDLWHELTG